MIRQSTAHSPGEDEIFIDGSRLLALGTGNGFPWKITCELRTVYLFYGHIIIWCPLGTRAYKICIQRRGEFVTTGHFCLICVKLFLQQSFITIYRIPPYLLRAVCRINGNTSFGRRIKFNRLYMLVKKNNTSLCCRRRM